jgi:putative glutamine amidotransferase
MSERRPAPLVGITCEAVSRRTHYDLVCDHRYAEAVKGAGGHPVLLPIASRRAILRRYLEGIDGLVIVGGDDVDPGLYGERPRRTTRVVLPRRTAFESWLYQEGTRTRLPMLAICYGMQLVNVLEGGSLYQHIAPPRAGGGAGVVHRARREVSHEVRLLPGTRLRQTLRGDRAMVPTQHHQAVRSVAPGFRPAAVADDGIIEAIEHPDRPELIAVQWHPERAPDSRFTERLFGAFVRRCRAHRRDP